MIFVIFFFVSSSWGNQGSVDILVSDQGVPKLDFSIFIDGESFTTDDMGFASADLDKGKHHIQFESQGHKKVIPFEVSSGERTQLLINIFGEQMTHDITEPVVKDIKTLEDIKEHGELELLVRSVNGQPLSGVRIFAKGVVIHHSTDRRGVVKLKLPVGTQVVSLTHPKFSTQVLRDIKISKDVLLNKRVELTPSGLVLEDFIVLAPNLKGSVQALIEVRRKASHVADVMSAEQMAKTGDSDAAGSLKRVTGLTLKDGKYVYIRGLGERYSTTLLNGINLPSPDPSRRVIPLDLFPTQFLDSMVIQKSYSPEQPGEFGGGVVMLRTKSMPEKFFAKIGVSQSQNSNDGKMLSYQGGSQDWLGVDDGRRKFPETLLRPGADLQQLKTKLPGTLMEQKNETLPELSLSVGDVWKFKKIKIGYTVSGVYKDDINFREETRGRYRQQEGSFVQEDDLTRELTTKEKVVGGIFGNQIQLFKNHKVSTNYINIRNTTDYVEVLQGKNSEENTVKQVGVEFAARTLETLLLQGESLIEEVGGLKLSWYFADSKARRDEPSRMRASYSPNAAGDFVFKVDDGLNLRYYDLQEKARDLGLSTSLPFPWFYKRQGLAKFGISHTDKSRQSSMQRFGLGQNATACTGDMTQSPDNILEQCPDSFSFFNRTLSTDNYKAAQTLKAYFFTTKWPLLNNLELSTGMRFEESLQDVETVSPFEKQNISTQLRTRDWLPGSALTWKVNKKIQTRLAYSETISRPDLRELSNTLWQDFDTGYDVQGNPSLEATIIKAYDARWEWYFAAKENLSFGVFYKDFKNPIEQVFTSGSDPRISYFNVNKAQIYGGEIEFSKRLNFITKWLRRFSLSGNYAYIFSDVDIGDIKNSENTERNRPIQGQSNYTMNILLDYDHERIGLNASFAYNVYGKRIAYMAPDGMPNIWERPFNQLDFVLKQQMTKTFNIAFKFKNILNPRAKFVQGGQEWLGYKKGQTYQLGLSMAL